MAKKIKIRPLDDRVVVEPIRAEEDDGGRDCAAGHGQGKAAAWHGGWRWVPASCWTMARVANSVGRGVAMK